MHNQVLRYLLLFVATFLVAACQKNASEQNSETTINNQMTNSIVYRPDLDITELFQRVQNEKIFSDTKTFVDASPKDKPSDILKAYHEQKGSPSFKLKAFVKNNFVLPAELPITQVNKESDMIIHLKDHWANLVRNPKKNNEYSTLVALPHPYVVPGGRFREMFYWDSYFTIVGLLQSEQDALALDMINNFSYLIDQYGFIPNGNRSYFLTRSQPPFFAAMLQLYGQKHGQDSIINYLPQLEKEYDFWMDGQSSTQDQIENNATVGKRLIVLEDGDHVNRYYGARNVPRAEAFNKESKWAEALPTEVKPLFYKNLRAACESGWDFSSRWFTDGITKTTINAMDIIPIDLSSLLYSMESMLAQLYQYEQDKTKAAFYHAKAEQRKAMIDKYHYDPQTGTYRDYNFVTGKQTGHLTMAMAFPLFFNAATPQAAKSVAEVIERLFLKDGGVVTSLVNSGEQWDYPNGWAPLQYISVHGLLQYQEKNLALDIAKRWLSLNERVYREDGKMMEKYNVVDVSIKAGGGNYPNQDGFGWTNGVDIDFYHLLNE
jgi:alpha,alpha-trehalase